MHIDNDAYRIIDIVLKFNIIIKAVIPAVEAHIVDVVGVVLRLVCIFKPEVSAYLSCLYFIHITEFRLAIRMILLTYIHKAFQAPHIIFGLELKL